MQRIAGDAGGPTTRGRVAVRALAVVVTSIATGLVLAGCTSAASGPSVTAASPTAPTASVAGADPTTEPAADPIELIGLWRVSDAAGESADTWLRLGAGELALWRECGMLHGMWTAGDQAFLSQIFGWSGSCHVDSPVVPWLDAATAYRATESGWQLVDADGEVVASLAVDGAPEPIENADPSYAEPPVVDDGVRAAFADVQPLPEALKPATGDDLIGRWVPAGGGVPTDPHIVFLTGRSWTGSDGCNGSEGRWAPLNDGGLLTTSGGSTLIGCEGAQVPDWVTGARLAGFDGAELVLLDRDAVELGRLVRDGR